MLCVQRGERHGGPTPREPFLFIDWSRKSSAPRVTLNIELCLSLRCAVRTGEDVRVCVVCACVCVVCTMGACVRVCEHDACECVCFKFLSPAMGQTYVCQCVCVCVCVCVRVCVRVCTCV